METKVEAPEVSKADFKAAMRNLPGPVTALTTWGPNEEPLGATLSAVTSLSLDPPMILASLAKTSDTLGGLRPGSSFALHVLCEGQQDVAIRLAGKGSKKFEGVEWQPGINGLPEIAASATILACEVEGLVPGGDHVIVLGSIHEIELRSDEEPLVYHRQRMHTIPCEEAE
jgi:flavin reductase (DIM6/NTAB) family NADH-FMN oxidoreductase RutF